MEVGEYSKGEEKPEGWSGKELPTLVGGEYTTGLCFYELKI